MKFQDQLQIIKSIFGVTNQIVPYLEGPPGGGKTALAKQVGRDMEFDNVQLFYASLRDPTDLLGTPNNNGEVTRWVPPEELYKLRTGRNLLILDEIADANQSMQNGLCSLIHERVSNNVILSPQTYIIATGNRTEDKSGASRLVTKLLNRMMVLPFDVNIDDFSEWALDNGVDHVLVQFLRFRPNLLIDFDPNRKMNPTPRAWEKVSMIPTELPSALYFGAVAGWVGEGAAAEYTGFRRIYEGLPDINGILMNPSRAEVPTDPAVLYALTGALAQRAGKDNFGRLIEYVLRLKPEFQVMCINDAQKLKPEVKHTKAFVNWAVKNASVLL